MFRKLAVLFMSLCSLPLCAGAWSVGAFAEIPDAPQAATDVYLSCNPATGQFLATWINSSGNHATYAIYTQGEGWGESDAISMSYPATIENTFVASSYNPITGTYFATWTAEGGHPIYAIYTPGEGWGDAAEISMTNVGGTTFNVCDPTTGVVMATWATLGSGVPKFSTYTPGTGWSTPATISADSPALNVYTCVDPSTAQFLGVWQNQMSGQPEYSFFTSGSWGTVGSLSDSTTVENDIYCVYNPTLNQYMAVWANLSDSNYPTYSIYTPGTGWSVIMRIAATSSVEDNVTVNADPITGQWIALWSDESTTLPMYSIYTSSWSAATPASATFTTGGDVQSAYYSGQFMAALNNNTGSDNLPSYAFFTYSNPLSPYDINRLTPIYLDTVAEAKTILEQAGLP